MLTLRNFRSLLADHPGKSFQLRLPDGNAVPESFHITEVGRVQKTFLDCGGRMHEQESCLLQAWLGGDEDHRLATGKLARIMDKARAFLPDEDIPLEIEYEHGLISQYRVSEARVTPAAVVLQLEGKHTDCLARETCGVADTASTAGCGCATGCCS